MSSFTSLVSAKQLHQWITKPDCTASLKILFVTMTSGPGKKPKIVKDNPDRYIPGSIHFDFQGTFSDTKATLSNTMVSHDVFQAAARSLGINNEDTVVVYDDFGNFCASRVWFMFKSVGFNKVLVLDGGLPNYLRLGLPTNTYLENPTGNKHGKFMAKFNKQFQFVDQTFIEDNLRVDNIDLFDARSPERFQGAVPEEKPELRSGHIPKSNNLHYAKLLDEHFCFLDNNDLRLCFANTLPKSLIFSCGSGVTACILAQVAYSLGVEQLYVYDGSWSQWGANYNLPIEVGHS